MNGRMVYVRGRNTVHRIKSIDLFDVESIVFKLRMPDEN